MTWLLAAISGIAFVELLLRLPFFATLGTFGRLLPRISAVLRSDRISDHWKEKVLPRYAATMLRATLILAVCLIAAFLPFMACIALAQGAGIGLLGFSMSWVGIGFITLVALIYARVRPALVSA